MFYFLIKNFPYLTDHTIQWARNLFEGYFIRAPQNYLLFKKNPEQIKKMSPSELAEIYDDIVFVHENIPAHHNECIHLAYIIWHENFRDQLHHLIIKYPIDAQQENIRTIEESK